MKVDIMGEEGQYEKRLEEIQTMWVDL